ncbi:hypothetical protein [Sphingobacterium sp. DR205]|uniref:hypothetical protein n=1 Tax=Sphingobacterium sp. DR205 TaxID=2713573 RepID=UPI0013E4AC1E|nr:hypothetical protein [Sphingobacterium sp. DR205]QIH33487.1 hypothetical protein G6053_11580 [Sphingobacterium sp. DR205]
MPRSIFIIVLLFFIPFFVVEASAQSENGIEEASLYLEKRTTELNKYIKRADRIQQRLLHRLQKKEARMLARLAAKDSVAYKQYLHRSPGFDSIAVLSKDSTALARVAKRRNATIDSLKGIQQFMHNQGNKLAALEGTSGQALPGGDYSGKIAELQGKLNAEQQVKDLIRQRTQSLEQMAAGAGIPGLQGIKKDVYYAQEKMKAWRGLADDPDAAEEKAMEYLQGIEGFESYISNNKNGLGSGVSAADLQAMGYQTKGQVQQMLSEKFGNLQVVQQAMQGQLKDFSNQLGKVTDKVKEAGNLAHDARQGLQEAKATKDKLKHIDKPHFRKNPERGKPFWQRLETQYNFQTTRATPDGLRPAMVELGAGVAFKHTPGLSYGIGIGASIGLGQDWQHIRLSYEGISGRLYADWKLLYGFSLQAGYERAFRPQNRAYLQDNNTTPQQPSTSTGNGLKAAFGGGQEAAYLGIMKRYRIGSKWNGTFMAGYNFLWQQSNLRTPFMLRLGWGK